MGGDDFKQREFADVILLKIQISWLNYSWLISSLQYIFVRTEVVRKKIIQYNNNEALAQDDSSMYQSV